MAPISGLRYRDHNELTGQGIVNIISYWPSTQRTHWHDARICLGETRTDALNRFDLCYSFKILCRAEYRETHQLHLAMRNYVRNYAYSTGIHQNRQLSYKRALRNLTVLMFSHFVHQLENSRSVEGHWTLIVHKCLQVAAALGRYHRWQRRVNLQEISSENADWNKIPTVAKGDYQFKYSSALMLLGNAQNPAYTHPKLLGRCYDNVYYNGRFIGDLPERGKPPSVEQSKKVYTQEYQEVVAWIENSLDLMEESPLYSVVSTSLVNLDIVLPHKLFLECRGLLEVPLGQNPEPREYEMDGSWDLIDLDWSQRTSIFHPDDINRDPRFSQYPFKEGDNLDDDEEEMEVESRPSGGAGDASMAPPTDTQCSYQCLPATYSFESAQTPGSPRSTHTNTDAAMEMGGLSVAPGGPDQCHVTQRGSAPPVTQRTMSTSDLAATVAWGVVAAATEILERFTRPLQVNEADQPLVDLAADAAIQERFQRWLAAATPATTGLTSAFDRHGHRTPTHQEEDKFVPRPEMTPRKIDRGWQPHKEQETQRAVSQKHRSQSRLRDEVDPKRGRTECEGKPGKVQVGIDWLTTGIQKPVSKSDSRPPSSKLGGSGPSVKSTVVKVSQRHASASRTRASPEGKLSRTSNPQLGDPEKREIRDKPHRWIESWVKRLDPASYMEEINSQVILGGMLAALPCRLWPSPTGDGNTLTRVSSIPYLCSPHSCSPPTRFTPGGCSGPREAIPGERARRGCAPKK